jgi:hypothetical protein
MPQATVSKAIRNPRIISSTLLHEGKENSAATHR